MLEIRLFGHLRVTGPAAPAALALRPRAQRLLAFLLLHRRQTLPRSRVAFLLWPDLPEAEALATFRRALSELRGALPAPPGGEWIASHGDEVRWNVDAPQWLDVAEFEAGIRAGTVAGLERAVAAYTGDLLAEYDEPWIDVEREQFRERQFSALRKLAAHQRAAGEHTRALALARQALALEPLAESVYRDIVLALYEGGDRAAALAEYDRLARLLRDELGVEPMAELQQLRAAIAAGAPTAPARVSPAPAESIRAAPGLVGRELEMEMLRNAWDCAQAGRGRCVIVSGEAGVGKTHLVEHLAAWVPQQAGLPLIGHCYEFEHALPYEAIAEMLRAAANPLRQAALAPIHRASLAWLVPGAVDNPPSLPLPTPLESRLSLFEAAVQAFLILAAQQPILLIFEDVQWAAESTLDWLTYVMPRLSANRVLMVITHRTSEVGGEHALTRLRQRFSREGVVATLLVKPLSVEAYREFIAQRSGCAPEHVERMAERLFAETNGNPFFMRELIQGLVESGQLVVDQHGRWSGSFPEAALTAQLSLPESLRETIAARVARLPESARTFLTAAAVAGRVFDYRVVRTACGWSEEAALQAMERLLSHELVRETESPHGFVFAHHLVQEALFAGLAAPRRQYWHRRLIEGTQQVNPWDYAALTRHAQAAGERDLAIANARRAAQEFVKQYAYDEAIHHLQTALDLTDTSTPPEVRLAVLEALADNRFRLRQGLEALAGYQAALELWRQSGGADKITAIRLHRKIFRTTFSMWETAPFEQFVQARQVCAALSPTLPELLAFIEREPPHREFVGLLKALAGGELVIREPADAEAAQRYCQSAIDLAERLEAPVERSSALLTLALIYSVRGMLLERREVALQALAITRHPAFDDVPERIRTLVGASAALIHLGDYAAAIPYVTEAEQLADQIRAVDLQNQTLSLLVYCWFRLDRWAEMQAVEARRRELQRLYRLERLGAPCFPIGLAGAVRGLQGDVEQAELFQAESNGIMSLVSGPPTRWGRSQHF